jgi:hypothetical protein
VSRVTRAVGRRLGAGGAVRRAGDLVAVGSAAALGVLIGAVAMAGVQDARSGPGGGGPDTDADHPVEQGASAAPGPVPAPASAEAADRGGQDEREAPALPAAPAVLLAWTPGGLDAGLAAAATADPTVAATSVVRGGVVDLVASRDAGGATVDGPALGWAIPLDAVAIAPEAHARFASGSDRATVAGLREGRALLGATSAELRRLGPGSVIDLAGGGSVTVAGVVSDTAIGGAEMAVDLATGERLGLGVDRYLLAAYDGERAALEGRLRSSLPAGAAVRFRGPGETPFLRNGDAVLPQVLIKQRFGEFAYRPGAGDGFDQDPAWQDRNLVTVDLPIIGQARCHREVADALAGALGEVASANLAGLIDPDGFAGCWNARNTRAGTSVSRHAWGVAVDLNFGTNPTGLASVQDPRLVAIFRRWGFTDGSGWLVPDAGHFEYVSPPRR